VGGVGDFNDLSESVYQLYSRGDNASALELVESGWALFPGHKATLTFWRCCFVSLLGDPASALEGLEIGLSAGLWWAGPTLRGDPDLEAVRQLDSFASVLAESEKRWREAMSDRPSPTVIVRSIPANKATLVVLQGGSGPVDEVVDSWRTVADLGCTLVVPGRGQPTSSDGNHANWIDEERTDQEIIKAVAELDLGRVLIAGYSAGGREALRIGLAGAPVEATGLLLFGPAPLRPLAGVHAAAERGLRVWTFVGEDDWVLDEVVATDNTLRDAGVEVKEHRAPSVGHVVPSNLVDLIPAALKFVLAS
jgi:dienelactone hydrolase